MCIVENLCVFVSLEDYDCGLGYWEEKRKKIAFESAM